MRRKLIILILSRNHIHQLKLYTCAGTCGLLDVPVWPCAIRLRSPLGGGSGGGASPPFLLGPPTHRIFLVSVSSHLPRLRLVALFSWPSVSSYLPRLRLIVSSSSPSHRIFTTKSMRRKLIILTLSLNDTHRLKL